MPRKHTLRYGIAQLLRREKVFAFRYAGTRYDCGSKLGFLQATVDLGWWFTPGGRIRKNEPLADALRRMARDELGLHESALPRAHLMRPGPFLPRQRLRPGGFYPLREPAALAGPV